MIVLDASIIFTGQPSIQAAMNLSATALSWVQNAYTLVFGGLLLLGARAGDISESPRSAGRFDVVGAVSSTLGMGALVFGIVNSTDAGWISPATVTSLAAAAVLLTLLVVNERRAKQPIMPLRLFASRERAGAYAARMLFAGTMIAFFYLTTQFLQGVYHCTPFQAGIAFFPMTVVNFFVALFVPRLTQRFGNAILLAAGLTLTLAGIAWLSQITAATPYLTGVALPMVLLGVGQGLAFGPLTAAGISGTTADDAGAASGLVNTAHQLGSSLGVGILVTASAGAPSLAESAATAYTGGTFMLSAAVVIVLALVVPAEIAARRTARRREAERPVQTATT
jgi:predicted MFS family arabinose efflux permease